MNLKGVIKMDYSSNTNSNSTLTGILTALSDIANSNIVCDDSGEIIPNFLGLAVTINKNAEGKVTSETITNGTTTWVRSYTYPLDTQTVISMWIKQ